MYANASVNPAIDALMDGVTSATSAVAPMTQDESKLNRIESHLLAARKSVHNRTRLTGKSYLPTSSRKGSSSIAENIHLSWDGCNRYRLTVSTQQSISRKNLDDAPNARNTVTPEIVSP